jgi:hypothetical protein
MRDRWPAIAAITSAAVVLTATLALHSKAPGTSAAHTVTGFTVEGADEIYTPSTKPRIEVAFRRESYRSGSIGKLVIFSKRVRKVSVQLFRAGTEHDRISARDEMQGTPVSGLRRLGVVRRKQAISVPIPNSPSGLYFAKVTGPRQRVGYAPFIIRPGRLGDERVAIVLPTLTWQAYNRRDDDGDGRADTWYADRTVTRVLLNRPFDQRGVPPNYKYYDQPFLRWLIDTKRTVDYLAQSDVAEATGWRLAAAYDLLVFPGHHEYVTSREYDAVEGFRNRGGNLMFLSANNFFWKTVIRGNHMSRVAKWRDVGRPEAALIGVQYIGNDGGTHRDAYHVLETKSARWLFEGTELIHGSTFAGGFGIEIDKRGPSSPRSLRVLAELPNLLGPGKTAQMTYYEKRGARVFAAGSFGLAGSLGRSPVNVMMENLWAHLAPAAPGSLRRIRHALRSRAT